MTGEPGVPPGASEATRLLCAGTYLDAGYRDAVIEELYVHEERLAAPSLGHDAARVLAHALRARRSKWAGRPRSWDCGRWVSRSPTTCWPPFCSRVWYSPPPPGSGARRNVPRGTGGSPRGGCAGGGGFS
ncbi:hypothetical protein ACFQ51_25490 [Streptomyces kaempferi]